MKKLILVIFLFPLMIWSQSTFETAEKLYKEQKFALAEPIFEKFLKTNPSNLKTIEYLGDIAGRNKLWDKSLGYYKKLKQLKPSEANYHYKYGGALGMKAKNSNKFKALGMIDEVKGSFEKAINLNPQHIGSRWALIELYIQLPAIVGGSESKAIKYSSELLRLSAVDGHLSRGHIEEHFKRYGAAEQHFKKAIAAGGSKNSYEMLANLYKNKMNQPSKAKTVLETYNNKNVQDKL